jgi:hypothetical protein
MDPDVGTLKMYEREILRARNRVDVADIDNQIDALIVILVGKLTKAQHQEYQAARLQGFIATPELIIESRAALLNITSARVYAPDVLTLEESAGLVVIMRAILDWLLECQQHQMGVSFQRLVQEAQRAARNAYDIFVETYHREPQIDDVPESLMRVGRARAILKLAGKTIIKLPPMQGE